MIIYLVPGAVIVALVIVFSCIYFKWTASYKEKRIEQYDSTSKIFASKMSNTDLPIKETTNHLKLRGKQWLK